MAEWRRAAFGEPPPLFPAAASIVAAQHGRMQVLATLTTICFTKGLNCPAWSGLSVSDKYWNTFDARVGRDPGMRSAMHQDGIHGRCKHQCGHHRQLMIPTGDTRKLHRGYRGTQGDFHSKGILKLTWPVTSIFQFGKVLLAILSNQSRGRRDWRGGEWGGGFAQQDLWLPWHCCHLPGGWKH